MTQDIPAALLFLLLSGFAGAVLLELLLRRAVRVGSLAAPRMHMQIVIGAPLPRVWEYASDVQRQPEWMHEMKRVEMLTPGPVRVGSRGRATVRIFGISTTDDVVIT
ncbi:MAG: SRPBCC family protein, partial [Candidatus Limnocylindrus sp.]